MSIKYSDPYGQDSFGKIKGDKRMVWFKVYFDEGKLYKQDDSYVLAANLTGSEGVSHSFGMQGESAPKGLATLSIHGKEYEERKSTGKKDDRGKWIYETFKSQPSVFEQWLYQQIENNPAFWLPEGKSISGNLTFPLDPQVILMPETQRIEFFKTCYQISEVATTDKVPEWKPKAPYRANSYGGKGTTIEDKVKFLKQELIATSGNQDVIGSESSIGVLFSVLLDQHREDEQFLVLYTDLLKAIVS
ncbi:MAG: hypothetical protein ACFCU5_20870 [Pleurocapsa sp.]